MGDYIYYCEIDLLHKFINEHRYANVTIIADTDNEAKEKVINVFKALNVEVNENSFSIESKALTNQFINYVFNLSTKFYHKTENYESSTGIRKRED